MTSPVRAPRPTPRRAPQPTPSRRSHLRVVPPPVRRRRSGPAVVAAMAVIFASLLASAVLHGLLASGQTHLDQLDADLRQERTELAREQLELANLRSPERIAAEAAADGMVPATTVHWMSAASGDETVVLRDGSGEADEATPEATTDDPAATTAQELASGTAGGTDR